MDETMKQPKHEGTENTKTHDPLSTSQSTVSGGKKVLIIGAGKPSSFPQPLL
jgi:hypothetical protein